MASSVQIQWEQQNPDQLLQHEMEQKKALQQLSSAVQQLEQKLTGIMAAQSTASEDWNTYCQTHSHLQHRQLIGSCAAVLDQEAAALSTSGRHPLDTSKALAESERHPDEEPSSVGAITDSGLPQSSNVTVDAVDVSCSGQTLSAATHIISAEACKEHGHVGCASLCAICSLDTSTQHNIQPPATAYARWLSILASVESASAQLQTQACRSVGSSVVATYAQLLQANPQTSQL